MRALLLGTDFMYNSNGNLVPVEINTNVGMNPNSVEYVNEIFNIEQLREFIIINNFTKLTYIGNLYYFNKELEILSAELPFEYVFIKINTGLTVPFIEDTTEHLIIRSAYDVSAIVDEEYCKNKINFLNLIKNQTFGSEFAYIDENGLVINNITNINNNGNHPNFILKSVLPQYDRNIYPKYFKVNNESELNDILTEMGSDYFLMEFHYNENKLYENHLQVIRGLNIIFPPDLISIPVGQYTKLTGKKIDNLSIFNEVTHELSHDDRIKYISNSAGINSPKLLDTDKIVMSDGTFKTALELNIGDSVKTILIPNPNEINLDDDLGNFLIDYDTFISGSTYSQNTVINKIKVDKLVDYSKIEFTDGTFWEDTSNSTYLTLRNNEVRFLFIDNSSYSDDLDLNVGDQVILIDTTDPLIVSPVLKEVKSISVSKYIFSGWEITVEETHIFLTQNSEGTSYAAIEHNYTCAAEGDCSPKPCNFDGRLCCSGACVAAIKAEENCFC